MSALSTLRAMILALPSLSTSTCLAASFDGQVVVEWLIHEGQDRRMKLRDRFTFIDRAGKRWTVPAGSVIDGASIPPLFWQVVGPPFVGDYRYASVVHDFYCDVKTEDWKATHRMFYDASVAAGVSVKTAKLMYAAVYAGGPRWKVIETKGLEGTETFTVDQNPPGITEQRLREIEKRIDTEDLSLANIEAAVDLNPR